MAVFCENIGPMTPDARVVYRLWSQRETLAILSDEAGTLGTANESTDMDSFRRAWI